MLIKSTNMKTVIIRFIEITLFLVSYVILDEEDLFPLLLAESYNSINYLLLKYI